MTGDGVTTAVVSWATTLSSAWDGCVNGRLTKFLKFQIAHLPRRGLPCADVTRVFSLSAGGAECKDKPTRWKATGKKKHAGVLGFFFWMITTLEASVARDPGLESDKKKSKKRNKSDEGDRERSATSQQPSD